MGLSACVCLFDEDYYSNCQHSHSLNSVYSCLDVLGFLNLGIGLGTAVLDTFCEVGIVSDFSESTKPSPISHAIRQPVEKDWRSRSPPQHVLVDR